ncbi:LacI family DNA-binding transcriptional regulator [soil metagenome]|nr:LacI family DNA-binding transcriptional regulator [Gemmatimonadota bacterium]
MARSSGSNRITALDVAARAGVSQPTVSLVLSGNPRARVAATTRERVLEAAKELGYEPNLLARGLVLRRSYAIGLVISDVSNPFYLDVVRGAERVAADKGYAVLLCDCREITADVHLQTLRTRQVDGVIIDPSGAQSVSETLLAESNVIVIEEPSDRWLWVASDAASAGRVAAEHLLALGHRLIGAIGPSAAAYGFRARERAFVQALRAAGVSLPSEWLRRAPPTVGGGQHAMRALLAQGSRPTAVFCINDLVALGALKACLTAGVKVPSEMSIMGCDDIEMARIVTPELTSVAVPAREIGARAARLLLQRLEGKSDQRAPRPLPVRLVVRQTTSPPTPLPES